MLPRLVLTTVFAAMLAACSDESAAKKVAADATSNVAIAGCHPVQAGFDSCCPDGAFYDFDSDAFVPVGPPECATRVFDDPASCQPTWCADSWSPGCADDPNCWPEARACKPGDLPGCAVGTRRATPGGPCRPAGELPKWLRAKLTATGDGGPGHPDGAPSMDIPGPIEETRFCATTNGVTRLCDAAEKGCGPGRMPDPDKPGACMDIGVTWSCPPGFIEQPVVAGSNDLPMCAPDPADCGDDRFGGVQAGPGVVFVDASAAPGGDGTRSKPFVEIADAVTASVAATTVAVAAGTYKGGIWMTRSMKLLGRCAAMVHVDAGFAVGVGGGSPVVAGKKILQMLVRGIAVSSVNVAFLADDGAHIRFERVHVKLARGVGIAADGGWATVAESFVHNVQHREVGWQGQGVAVAFGGRAVVEDSRVSQATFSAVWAQGHDAHLDVRRSLLDNTRIHPASLNANGVSGNGANIALRSVRITRMAADGIRVENSPALLEAVGVLIDRIGPPTGPAKLGGGIIVVGPRARLEGVRLHTVRPFGIALAAPTNRTTINGLVIDGVGSSQQLFGGSGGVLVANGSITTIASARLHDISHIGLFVEATGTRCDVAGLTVTKTRPEAINNKGGMAVGVATHAELRLRQARLHDSRATGLVVVKSGRLRAQDVVVDGTRASAEVPDGGLGLSMDVAGKVWAERIRFSDNRAWGIQAHSPGTALFGRDIYIDGTRPAASGRGGGGISVVTGAHIRVRGAHIVDNRQFSAVVRTPGSRLQVAGLRVDATRAGNKGLGMGLVALHGGHLDVQGSHVSDSRLAGIHALGPDNTRTRIVGTLVELTSPGTVTTKPGAPAGAIDNLEGIGISAFRGPQRVDITASLVRKNHTAGIALTQVAGSIDSTVVVHTLPSLYEVPGTSRPGAEPTYTKLADAILVHSPNDVAIRRVIAVDLARAGILLDGKGKASVDRCAVTGSLFGLVSQAGVSADIGRNVLWDNLSNRSGEVDLYVPPAPKPIDL